jgi:hypothetical protein
VGAVARRGPWYVGVLLLSGLLSGLLLAACSPGPVEVDQPQRDEATTTACRRFLADTPATVADQQRRDVEPTDALARAWGDPAIVVTCGGDPPRLPDTASCLTVDGVDWYLPEDKVAAPGDEQGTVTMTTIGRDPAVRLTLPGDYWPPATALADLSGVVREDLPATGRCR